MHKMLIGGVAMVALTATGAGAGDFPGGPGPCRGPCRPIYPPPPPPPPPAPPPYLYYWCGPYLGVNAGAQWGELSNSTAKPGGVLGGAQAGYNWQFGQWVAGWEADLQFSSANDTFGIFRFSNPWFGTVRGRGGVAFDNVLLYGTLGLASGRGVIETGSLSEVNTHLGWTVGAGVEFGLSRHWSVKAEFLRVELSSEPFVLTGLNHGLSSDVFRIGVNYRF
jgi:outer membrane immunogenic protein